MPNELTARVIEVLVQAQRLEPGRVTAESTFEELGIDSLDGINIIFALENEFGIDIPDDSLPELRSVKDIAAGIAELLAAKGGS
jgi:acyl carrier protein